MQTSHRDAGVAPRDYVLASGPCTALGIIRATLWVRSQLNQRVLCEKYTVDRAPPVKIKPNQENQETGQAGSSGSATKGWEPSKEWDHGQVCSQFPLLCLGKAGLPPGLLVCGQEQGRCFL